MQTNHIAHGNNAYLLSMMPEASIDLIYADPPFNTGHDFNADQGGYSDKFTPTLYTSDLPEAYRHIDFRWIRETTTPSQLAYFDQMIPILIECHRVLKPTGAIYWHVDDKTSAWYRLILNQIFGQGNYRNEIIWTYTPSMLVFKGQDRRWRAVTDHLLFYAKSSEHAIEPQYHPLTAQERKRDYPYTDSKGRKYRNDRDTSTASIGSLPGKGERRYADENKGKLIGSCWTDIPIASNRERTGYPTQKPLYLLKRIIEASSQEGNIVLDPFCGSGTTLKAAQELKRRWIGIDQNEEAVEISKRRMQC